MNATTKTEKNETSPTTDPWADASPEALGRQQALSLGQDPEEGAPGPDREGWDDEDGGDGQDPSPPTETSDAPLLTWYVEIDAGSGGETTLLAPTLDDAWTDAIEWARGGEWEPGIVHVRIEVVGDYEDRGELVHFDVMPEPDCPDHPAHDWQSPHELLGGIEENPGVWGHGGGVTITEVCSHCGIYRVTDTWAQCRQCGTQGLEETTYRDADEASEAWLDGGDA